MYVLLLAFPLFELTRGLGAGEGQLTIARCLKVLPDDPVVFIVCAYPDP